MVYTRRYFTKEECGDLYDRWAGPKERPVPPYIVEAMAATGVTVPSFQLGNDYADKKNNVSKK